MLYHLTPVFQSLQDLEGVFFNDFCSLKEGKDHYSYSKILTFFNYNFNKKLNEGVQILKQLLLYQSLVCNVL